MPEIVSLIHLAGFATGIVLYGMLVAMTSREAHARATRQAVPSLLPVAAVLGLVWNAGALVVYVQRDFGLAEPAPWLVAIAFSALGFLPAVVVHASAMRGATGWRRAPVVLAYALSAAAAFFFVRGGSTPSLPSPTALLTLTVGYLLLVTWVALGVGREPARRRSVTMVALAALAATTLHLQHDATQPDSWWTALLGHHASIPLVLVILYQDFRFAFADRFLRRAIAVTALVVLAVGLHLTVAAPLVRVVAAGGDRAILATAALVTLWVLTALAYPVVYRTSSRLVDRVILNRGDYDRLRDEIAADVSRAASEEEAADVVCRALARALGTEAIGVRWHHATDGGNPARAQVTVPARERDRAHLLVPTAERPALVIELAPLPASRRLLSDEVVLLESLAGVLGRRVDVLRVARERFARDLREREILQLAAESELLALRAQLNPHFLFNALTTLGYLMQAAPERAMGTLYRLTALLRAVLRGPASESVPLGEELTIVADYLAIEQERFQERLESTIDVEAPLRALQVPPLLLQPLVENAVKHGISPLRRGGAVRVSARVTRRGDAGELHLTVADTGAGWRGALPHSATGTGVGLANLERRLDRLFGGNASLTIDGAPGRGTTVVITLPLDPVVLAELDEAIDMADDRAVAIALP